MIMYLCNQIRGIGERMLCGLAPSKQQQAEYRVRLKSCLRIIEQSVEVRIGCKGILESGCQLDTAGRSGYLHWQHIQAVSPVFAQCFAQGFGRSNGTQQISTKHTEF